MKVGISTQALDAATQSQIFYGIVMTLIYIVIGFITAYFLVNSITQPLVLLSETVAEFSAKNFKTRAKVVSKDEIGMLCGELQQDG